MNGNEWIDSSSRVRKFAIFLHCTEKFLSMSFNNSDVEFASLGGSKKDRSQAPQFLVSRSATAALSDKSSLQSNWPEKSREQLYFNKHRIIENIEDLMDRLAKEQPDDPYEYGIKFFRSIQEAPIGSPSKLSRGSIPPLESEPPSQGDSTNKLIPNPELRSANNEINDKFSAYLSNLATSIRRTTT